MLELGAATGACTLELARRSYDVTAVDVSPGLIEQLKDNAVAAGLDGRIAAVVADARDLAKVSGTGFDVVLMMGPLYHLVEKVDREATLQEALRRMRPGGLIFSAFLSRFGVLSDLIRNVPGWIEDQDHVRSLLDIGSRPASYPRRGFRAYFALSSEIAPLHEAISFQTISVVGVEPAIAAHDESFNQLEGRQREQWLDLLFEIGSEPSIVGASRHLLYIGSKPR